jgi:hypothetical protein
MNNLVCKDRESALSALEVLGTAMQGTQRESLLAVKDWVDENTSPPLNSEETHGELERKLFTPSEEEEKAWLWYLRREEAEPEDGMHWTFAYDAKSRQWNPFVPDESIIAMTKKYGGEELRAAIEQWQLTQPGYTPAK